MLHQAENSTTIKVLMLIPKLRNVDCRLPPTHSIGTAILSQHPQRKWRHKMHWDDCEILLTQMDWTHLR